MQRNTKAAQRQERMVEGTGAKNINAINLSCYSPPPASPSIIPGIALTPARHSQPPTHQQIFSTHYFLSLCLNPKNSSVEYVDSLVVIILLYTGTPKRRPSN